MRRAVSSEGGIIPVWAPDGRELYYVAGDSIVAVEVRSDGSAGSRRKLFARSDFSFRWHSYDPAPSGKRFLMIQREPGSFPRQLNVILNWTSELQQRAGAK
jgi:hypothetical protein